MNPHRLSIRGGVWDFVCAIYLIMTWVKLRNWDATIIDSLTEPYEINMVEPNIMMIRQDRLQILDLLIIQKINL